jgi:hypothetical protein
VPAVEAPHCHALLLRQRRLALERPEADVKARYGAKTTCP